MTNSTRHSALRTGAALGAAGLALAGAVATAAPAAAHDTSRHLSNGRGYGSVWYGHARVGACDTLGDGLGVRTQYRTNVGWENWVEDLNGHQPGCETDEMPSGVRVVEYRVCAGVPNSPGQNRVCTVWYAA